MASLAHATSRRYYKINPPRIDYEEVHGRLAKHLGVQMPLSEFEGRAERALDWLEDDACVSAAGAGVRVPFIMPKGAWPDIGEAMDTFFLPAVRDAFKEASSYEFLNHAREGMKGKVSVAAGSRHQRLLDAMADQEMVGWYLPCVLEYSVPAALEQMEELPDGFLLAGGFDTAAAFVGTPDLLLRKDGYPPLLWLSALGAEPGVGYHFEAYGYNLNFNRRPHLGQMSEYWSSALTVLG